MPEKSKHFQQLYQRFVDIPLTPPPAVWKKIGVYPITGLTDVGFAESTDLLLVMTSFDDRVLFDCANGVQIIQGPSGVDHDKSNLVAFGIGPASAQRFRTAGLHGGGLAITTTDGWSIDLLTLQWPDQCVFLTPPGHWLYGPAYGRPGDTIKVLMHPEIRTYGFSPTGRAFVIATSSELTIYSRSI